MDDMVSILADPGSLATSSCSASSRRKCLNIWHIAPSHQCLKNVLLFSKPQLNFQK